MISRGSSIAASTSRSYAPKERFSAAQRLRIGARAAISGVLLGGWVGADTYRYPAGELPSEQLPRRIPPEQTSLANVATHGGIRGMAGLLTD